MTLDILPMSQKYYFYIIKCFDGTRYYGHTKDLKQRFKDHSCGRVTYTKSKRPLELIYQEEFDTKAEAFHREMQFKNGKTRKQTIDKLIKNFASSKMSRV